MSRKNDKKRANSADVIIKYKCELNEELGYDKQQGISSKQIRLHIILIIIGILSINILQNSDYVI